MRYRLCYSLLLLVFTFISSHGVAASFPKTDTSVYPRKPHKLNQQQFLDRYGTDDSARALIRYYYPKRKAAVRSILQSAGLLIISGILSAIIFSTSTGIESGYGALFILLILLSSAYAGAAFILINTAILLVYSRKRLYRLLRDYTKGKKLPRRIIRKKSFIRLLKQEHENRLE